MNFLWFNHYSLSKHKVKWLKSAKSVTVPYEKKDNRAIRWIHGYDMVTTLMSTAMFQSCGHKKQSCALWIGSWFRWIKVRSGAIQGIICQRLFLAYREKKQKLYLRRLKYWLMWTVIIRIHSRRLLCLLIYEWLSV